MLKIVVSWLLAACLLISCCMLVELSSVSTPTYPASFYSTNHSLSNDSDISTTAAPKTTMPTTKSACVVPDGGADEEQSSSMTIFFILAVVGICIVAIHFLIKANFTYLPESVAVVVLGALVGLLIKALNAYKLGNWQKEEAFHPNAFFLILLPPIIFESGYNLHKGNFFANIGSIIVFAVIGTVISAMTVGMGIYSLGKAGVAYQLSIRESFAFGSLISAVDPVATLAIFHALNVDPLLNMLVFGESILNDAVSIVLTNAVLEQSSSPLVTFGTFIKVFLGSAAIGVMFALLSSLILKYIDLRQQPSLELAMMLVFSYAPYGLAEGLKLSGIMAILFCGVVMSHYAHFNLSPVTQITVQHLFRTSAFMAETLVFAYLGMAIFSFNHRLEIAFVIWSIVLILFARALNIFPLSALLNFFRETKINRKTQFIMWFSGLRGAIAFALSINLGFEEDKRRVLVTTTLVIVMFTLLILGGSTLPVLKFFKATQPGEEKLTLSKTKAEGTAVDAEQLTDDEWRVSHKLTLRGFVKVDARYLIPFFTRKITRQEWRAAHSEMQRLTSQWYNEVQSEDSEDNQEAVVKFSDSAF